MGKPSQGTPKDKRLKANKRGGGGTSSSSRSQAPRGSSVVRGGAAPVAKGKATLRGSKRG